MNKYILFFISIIILFSACDKSLNPKTEDLKEENPLKSAVVKQNNNFSLEIFKEIIACEDANTNVFISPLSMYYALAMAAIGSDTETRTEFNTMLGWNNMAETEVLEAMKELSNDLKPANENVTLSIANSMWQRQGASVNENYKSLVHDYFDAEARELDFSSVEAVEIINSWIEVKTNNLIKNMLDDIPADAFMYLINAIYYKADWLYKFKEEDSYDGDFIMEDYNMVDATFMTQKSNFQYFSNNTFQAIKLPYADTNFYMAVFLPNQEYEIADIINQINSENWTSWNSEYSLQEVTLTLPRFKVAYGVKLINEELQALGLHQAFEPTADFSKITDADIYISRVMHKAVIEVNEEGSEAAAATVVEYVETSAGNQLYFTANKPFVYAICHEPSNSILFIGTLVDPS